MTYYYLTVCIIHFYVLSAIVYKNNGWCFCLIIADSVI